MAVLLALVAVTAVLFLPVTGEGAGGGGREGEGEAAPKVVSLTEALRLSVSQSPAVDSAGDEVTGAQLGVEKSKAAYRVKVTGSSELLGLSQAEGHQAEWSFGESIAVSGSLLTPSGLSVSVMARPNDSDAKQADLELGLNWKLWPPPGNDASWRSLIDSENNAMLAGEKFRQTQLQAAAATYRQYRNLQIQEANLAVLEIDKSVSELAYTQVLNKYQTGTASRVEVLEATLARDRSRASYDKAVRDFERELAAFLSDLGLNQGLDEGSLELEKLPDEWADPIPVPPEELILSEVVAHSPGVLERSQALDSAERRLEAVRASNGWEISVKTSARKAELGSGSPSFGGYLETSYDFADGGLRKAELKEAELARSQAEKALNDEIQSVRDDVKQRISELTWLKDQYQIAATAFEKSSLEYEIKKEQYERGLIRELDYQQCVKALEEARLELARSAVSYEAARIELLSLMNWPLDVEGGIRVEIEE